MKYGFFLAVAITLLLAAPSMAAGPIYGGAKCDNSVDKDNKIVYVGTRCDGTDLYEKCTCGTDGKWHCIPTDERPLDRCSRRLEAPTLREFRNVDSLLLGDN